MPPPFRRKHMARTRGAFRAYVARRRGAFLRGRGRAVVFVALALAACAAPPAAPPAPPAVLAAPPAEAAKPVVPAVAPAPVARPLQKLIGLRAAQIAALLGRPDLRRRDGAA